MLQSADAPVAIKDDNVELRMTEVGAFLETDERHGHVADLGPALVGLPDDLCPCPHWGYMLEGRLKMVTKNGDEIYEAGQAFYWPAGHAPVAMTDVAYVDFSPTAEFAEVIRHITGGQ
jgi:hypothetical protein